MVEDENKQEQEEERLPETAPEECQPEKNPDAEDPRLYSPLIESDNPALKERSAEETPHPDAGEQEAESNEPTSEQQ